MIDGITRRKTQLPIYGEEVCSHLQPVTCQYVNCPGKGCLLHIIVLVFKRMVSDLMNLATASPKLKRVPTMKERGTAVETYWKK